MLCLMSRPSDYELAADLAGILYAFMQEEGLEAVLDPDTAILVDRSYHVSLTQGRRSEPLDRSRYVAEIRIADVDGYSMLSNSLLHPEPLRETMAFLAISHFGGPLLLALKQQEAEAS